MTEMSVIKFFYGTIEGMRFKARHMEAQLIQSPAKLQEVAAYFESLSLKLEIVPVVTRVWDPVPGESGVHPAKRAVDFRNELRLNTGQSKWLYTDEEVVWILNEMNEKFPRTDGKRVCIHHSFGGGPYHFHLQIPASWVKEK